MVAQRGAEAGEGFQEGDDVQGVQEGGRVVDEGGGGGGAAKAVVAGEALVGTGGREGVHFGGELGFQFVEDQAASDIA